MDVEAVREVMQDLDRLSDEINASDEPISREWIVGVLDVYVDRLRRAVT
jgi:hypothetical protein